MKIKILLLEDDIALSQTVQEYFEDNSIEIICAYDGEEALELIYENSFDLLLLDVNVPIKNGFEVLSELRKANILIPAIFITSLNSMTSLEEGYDSGCDDYIRKPFELKELLLRVQTLIKKEYNKKTDEIEIVKGVFYNTLANEVRKDGEIVKFNLKELKLLKLLLQNPNELLVHERIYDTVWDYDEEYSDNSLRTYMKNLRKVLGKDKIVSLKKLGYRFNQE